MSMPTVPSLRSASLVAGGRLRAGLEACGYHCAVALLPGTYPVFPGASVALQFGDRIATDADGITHLTIRAGIQIDDGDVRAGAVSLWQIRKPFSSRDPDRLGFVIEADLILRDGAGIADVLADGGDGYRHLQMLIADASATLRDLPVGDGHGQKACGPVVRIEAQFLGDLAAGRSGLVASDEPVDGAEDSAAATTRLAMIRAACAALMDDILPDLARAVGHMISPPPPSSIRTHKPVAALCDAITAFVHEPVQ